MEIPWDNVWKRWDKYWDTGDRTFLIWDGGFKTLFLKSASPEGYMIFDTHAHYDDEQFNEDRVELLNSMEEQGVGTIINVSATYNSCRKVIALAKEYPFVYAAVGIHPDEVGSLNEETFAQMKELFKEEKVVAVGEIGLDYYWDNEPREVQKKWFIRQLELARELDLPVLIHSREERQIPWRL